MCVTGCLSVSVCFVQLAFASFSLSQRIRRLRDSRLVSLFSFSRGFAPCPLPLSAPLTARSVFAPARLPAGLPARWVNLFGYNLICIKEHLLFN